MNPSEQEAELEGLLQEALLLEEEGQEVDLLKLAGGRAEVARAMERALHTVRLLPDLHSATAGCDPRVGSLLRERYRLLAPIGAGAMGVVYESLDLDLGRTVAVKVLRPGLFVQNEALARFEREAEVLANLHHPCVVTLHDRGQSQDGEMFLIMERLEGRGLAELLDEAQELPGGPDGHGMGWLSESLGVEVLPESSYLRTCVRWIADLAGGLQAVHDAECLHRDVKPSNIFIRNDGRPVLLDFGLAAREDGSLITHDGSTVGTPAYLAPEMLESEAVSGPGQDVYGLAATAYHLLTNRPPYEGTPSQVLHAVATREPVRPARLRPSMPRDLQAILEHGLARDPARRYPTARALEEDLRAFLDYRPVSARPTTLWSRGWRRLQRSRAARGAAAVVLLLGSLGGARALVEARRDARAALFEEAWSHVLVNDTISEYLTNRVSSRPEENERRTRRFDAAVSVAATSVPARVLRAAHRLDLGDTKGAQEDMRAVAREFGSPYCLALAARFDGLDPGAAGMRALPEADMPSPEGQEDHFLAAYQALRELRYGDGLARLGAEELDGYRPAEELRLLLHPLISGMRKGSDEEVVQAAARWHEQAVRFEESLPCPTALTAHVRGSALGLQRRWSAALAAAEEAIALAPDSSPPRTNAAWAAFRLGRHEDVVLHARPVIASLPDYPRPYETLLRSLLEEDLLDEAERVLREAPFPDRGTWATTKLELGADLLALRAWRAEKALEHERAREHGREATALYDELATNGTFRPTPRSLMARALVHGDRERLFDAMLASLREQPTSERRLAALLDFVPESLDPGNRESIVAYLEALRAHLLDLANVPTAPSSRTEPIESSQ